MLKSFFCAIVITGLAGTAMAQLPSLPSLPSVPSVPSIPGVGSSGSAPAASPTQGIADKACAAIQNKICPSSLGLLKQPACLLAAKSKMPKACKNTNNPASALPGGVSLPSGVSLPKL